MSDWDAFWTKTRWSYDELNGKTVDFVLTGSEWRVTGKGTFQVIRSPKDKKHIVQTVDTDREKIVYRLLPGTGQARHFDTIELDGFVKLPSGFFARDSSCNCTYSRFSTQTLTI